jgi:hypothetical protein
MGFRCSFVVSKTEPDVLLDALGFEASGEVGEMPEEGRWCARLIHTGWSVIFANDFELPAQVQDQIAELSRREVQYIGVLSETSMCISISRYALGNEDWAIDWAGDQGFELQNLSARGNLPAKFETYKADAIEAQMADRMVDYIFEIPVHLLNDESGFRYDDWHKIGDVDTFRLVAAKKRK